MTRSAADRATATLCVTQLVSWGVLFYAFPVLRVQIVGATGWADVGVSAAFTAGLLVWALLSVPAGRLLDAAGPRRVMAAGSVLGPVALLGVAASPGLLTFVVAWVVVGVAMSGVLYAPAFATLSRLHDEAGRVRALVAVTVAGGLASTVFAPLTAVLGDRFGWRAAVALLAGVLLVLTLPPHLRGLPSGWTGTATGDDAARPDDRTTGVTSSRPFVLLAAGLGLASTSGFGAVVGLVPLLHERGAGTQVAAAVLAVGGASQVAGRLGWTRLARVLPRWGREVVVMATVAVTTAALALVVDVVAVVAIAVVAGAARGLMTLVQATAVVDRWGRDGLGRLTGALAAPVTLAMACAPWLEAQLAAALDGHAAAFLVLAGLGSVGTVLVAASEDPPAARPAGGGGPRAVSLGRRRRARR